MDCTEVIRQRHTASALKYLCSTYVDGLVKQYVSTALALEAAVNEGHYDAVNLLTRQGNREWKKLMRASGAIIA